MDKEKDKKAYAHAEKAYMQGTLFPFIKVGMQKSESYSNCHYCQWRKGHDS